MLIYTTNDDFVLDFEGAEVKISVPAGRSVGKVIEEGIKMNVVVKNAVFNCTNPPDGE